MNFISAIEIAFEDKTGKGIGEFCGLNELTRGGCHSERIFFEL